MIPTMRSSLTAGVGESVFKGVFSLLSLAAFVGIVVGMKNAPYVLLWTPPPWSSTVANVFMPFAFYLLAAAYVPNNLKRVVRHPMLCATVLWALLHLLSNGDVASIILFGSFGLFALLDMVSVTRRSAPADIERKPVFLDGVTIVVSMAAFWLVRYFHGDLFGVALVY